MRPIRGTIAHKYLRDARLCGLIELPPYLLDGEVLRFDPNHSFGMHGRHPALVALYRDIFTDKPKGIHRTALKADGSDRVREWNCNEWKGKKMFGPFTGCAIKLAPDAELLTGLAIAEGIETALTPLAKGWQLPTWCAGSAEGVRDFPVLHDAIESLTVFADPGKGEEAAREVEMRWIRAGRECRVELSADGDWNATLMRTNPP